MKKFITIWISCSLALAANAIAQQDDTQQPRKKKKREQAEAAQQAQAPAKPQAERPAGKAHAGRRAQQNSAPANAAPEAPAKAPAAPAANPAAGHHKKGQKPQTPAQPNEPASPAPAASAQPEAQAAVAPQPNKPNVAARKNAAPAKKPDVQAIKARNANFHAQPKPQIPTVTFNESRRIEHSEQWQGERYAAFRSYHPQRRNLDFYRSHYSRVILIGGGYYYLNGGYWYPAWTDQPSQQYYAYDGPIYAGRSAEPPDKVIADVQSSLLEQGYYKGEVDGLLGPLTRDALMGYQNDYGLYTTGAIDEPTLASLDLG